MSENAPTGLLGDHLVESRLFSLIPDLDEIPSLEIEMFSCYTRINSFITTSRLNEHEITDQLVADASKSQDYHNQIVLALLYSILTSSDQAQAEKHSQWLAMITTDGNKFLQWSIDRLLISHYSMLIGHAKTRLFWLFSVLVKTGSSGIEDVTYSFLRCIQPGCTSSSNIELCTRLLLLLLEEREWLYQHTTLLCSSLYLFLRCITEHLVEVELVQLEVHFCITLLSERFFDCLAIGRDLVRALMDVARIEQFDQILEKLLNNPQLLCPSVSNVLQVLAIPPSAKILSVRITAEMERRLLFIMERVKLGNQKYHQSWFSDSFISSRSGIDSSSFIPDLIRYILCCFHPPANLGMVPRWACIGWLLKTIKGYHVASNAKLALFIDWFFFEPASGESVANLEPAIQVLALSASKYPQITTSLIEFLYLERESLYPPFTQFIIEHVKESFAHLTKSGISFDRERLFQSLAHFPDAIEMFCELSSTQPIKQPDIPVVGEEELSLEEGEFAIGEDSLVEESTNRTTADSLPEMLDIFLFTTGSLPSENSELLRSFFFCEPDILASYWNRLSDKVTSCIVEEHSECGLDISKATELFFIFKFLARNMLEAGLDMRNRFLDFGRCIIPTNQFLIISLFVAYDEDDFEFYKEELFSNEKYLQLIVAFKEQNESYFYSMLHRLFLKFSPILSGNADFLRMHVLQDINPATAMRIKLSFVKESHSPVLFGSLEQMFALLGESLEWESYEQIFLWDLLVHFFSSYISIDSPSFLVLLESLLVAVDFNKHYELLAGLFNCLVLHAGAREAVSSAELARTLVFLRHPQPALYQEWTVMLFTRLALLFPLEMQDVFVELIGEAEHTPYETQQQTNQILLQFLMPFTRETNTTLLSLVKNDVFIGRLGEICTFIAGFEELLQVLS